MLRRWGWPLLVGALALLGVLLAIADTALYGPTLGPYATFLIGPSQAVLVQRPSPDPERFIRTRFPERISFGSPFGRLGTMSPVQALRAFLSNGAAMARKHGTQIC